MAAIDPDDFRRLTVAHYRDAFAQHGATPRGVDWNGAESQEAHFAELLKLFPSDPAVGLDVNDLGCGYGAFAGWLAARRRVSRYRGYDVNADMVAAARGLYADPAFGFEVADAPTREADYGVASGVFTLRLGRGDDECWRALADGAAALDRTSRSGFAFNCLTSYSDPEKMRDHLYYPDPCRVFDHCKRNFSRQVALLHDYGLFAFTIIVRREGEPS